MTSPAISWSEEEDEARLIEDLRARYEHQGFTFIVHPSSPMLPEFVGSYRPDALAQKPGFNIAIEIKSRNSSTAERSIVEIRRKFVDRSDWRLDVVLATADPMRLTSIRRPAPAIVHDRLKEVATLNRDGHSRAAFLLAWSLLEAALHAIGGETSSHPRTPGAVVQALAMNGSIDADMERRLRGLTDLRNRIVHGDLSLEPTSDDVQVLLSAIDEALTEDAA